MFVVQYVFVRARGHICLFAQFL